MREHAVRIGQELHLLRIERQIAGAQILVQAQAANVDLEFGRDVGGQAFDFDFAGDHFIDAAVDLDACRFAKGMNGHLDLHPHVHRNAQEIHVQQTAADRIDLPILHDRRFVLSAQVHLKQSVVTGFRTENRGDLLGVHGERNRFAFAAVKSCRNPARRHASASLRFCPVYRGARLPQ